MFKIVRLIFFALIVQLRISAWLSFSNKGEAPFWDKMQISGMNGSKVFWGRKVLFVTKTFRLSQ